MGLIFNTSSLKHSDQKSQNLLYISPIHNTGKLVNLQCLLETNIQIIGNTIEIHTNAGHLKRIT